MTIPFRARFQLFGDTMNTCARMESTGVPNKIHISTETADLLIASGKSNWVIPREDQVLAKGLGYLSTYFLVSTSSQETSALERNASVDTASSSSSSDEAPSMDLRYVNYNTEVLKKALTLCITRRKVSGTKPSSEEELAKLEIATGVSSVLDEYKEVILFSKLCSKPNLTGDGVESGAVLDNKVAQQLRRYVQEIASLYDNENPFHKMVLGYVFNAAIKKWNFTT